VTNRPVPFTSSGVPGVGVLIAIDDAKINPVLTVKALTKGILALPPPVALIVTFPVPPTGDKDIFVPARILVTATFDKPIIVDTN